MTQVYTNLCSANEGGQMIGWMYIICMDPEFIMLICQNPSHAISRQHHVTTITYLLLRNAHCTPDTTQYIYSLLAFL